MGRSNPQDLICCSIIFSFQQKTTLDFEQCILQSQGKFFSFMSIIFSIPLERKGQILHSGC